MMEEPQMNRVRLLPDDVLADVLGRLAPRGLATSRCVCTAWRAVIDGRGLLRADLLPPRSLAGLLVQYGSLLSGTSHLGLFSRRPSTYRLPYRSHRHFQDHCNGLVLLDDAVLNPATGRRAPLHACPPLPAGMEFFVPDMYLVFDPAAATLQYEVVSVPRVPDRDVPDDEFTKQLRRIYRNYPSNHARVGRSLLGSEWPPWETGRRSVYWKGALYVHCEIDFVMRISMSNNTYRVIKPPRGIPDIGRQIYFHLGRSEKGVYSAFLGKDNKLQVWILEESSNGETEWTLRHDSGLGLLLQASLNCGRQARGPWVLHDPTDENKKPIEEYTFDEWNSDDDDDDTAHNIGDCSAYQDYYENLEILGFHPYKEIVFLHRRLERGLAYHLQTSKLEDLGDFYPYGSRSSSVEACVPYTPYLAGELPRSYLPELNPMTFLPQGAVVALVESEIEAAATVLAWAKRSRRKWDPLATNRDLSLAVLHHADDMDPVLPSI